MNKTQFISFMETPDKISGGDSLLLSELIKNFPYFQTAHLLYTKGLHNQNSIHYNNQLKITAAYATDRKVLHRLITKPQQTETKTIKIPEIQKETEQKEITIPVINTVKEEIKTSFTKPVVEEIPTVKEETTETKKEIAEVSEIVPAKEKTIIQKAEVNEVVASQEAPDPLEKEYISEIINTSVEIEILNVDPIEFAAVSEKEQDTVESNFILNTVPEPINNKKNEPSHPSVDIESLSFTDWLKHVNLGSIVTEQPESKEVRAAQPEKNLGAFDLIDKFIREEPKISRPKNRILQSGKHGKTKCSR